MTLQFELDKSIEQEENLSKVPVEREGTLDISDSLKCHRMRYLKFYGHPGKTIQPSGLRRFLMGRVVEKVLISYWRFRGVIVRKSQYLKHYIDGRIRGKTDFTIIRDGKNYLAELKSYDGWGYYRRKKDQANISKNHEAQALNYVDILLNQKENIEDRAIIVEGSRDNLDILETFTRTIGEVVQELHDDWTTLIVAIDAKKIPDVLIDFPKAKECSWCMRKEICTKLYEEENPKQKKPTHTKGANNTE